MTERYFATARTEIMPFLPGRVERLLDVGCGAGATVAAIRAAKNVQWAGGVEIVEDQARAAQGVCDRVWCINIEQSAFESEIPQGSLDLVLCLDVLEHLVDPWAVVQRLSALLRPGGRLIVSVPNIRNWKFIKNLLLRGDFHYRDSGLLDRTHLRFFVRETAQQLATSGGLTLAHAIALPELKGADARAVLNAVLFGSLTDILAKQWMIVVEKPA